MTELMKDEHGNEFTYDTVHCWNCKYYCDVENSPFSLCEKRHCCIVNKQLRTLNPIDCVYFESRRDSNDRVDETV